MISDRPGERLTGALLRDLKESRKYRHLSEDALLRISRDAAMRFTEPRRALKWAKRRLHQAVGAFVEGDLHRRLGKLLEELPGLREPVHQADVCRRILGLHASTRERLGDLPGVYAELFGRIGVPRSVLDLACGLNPFTLPWMGLSPGSEYVAVDMDRRLVSAAGTLLHALGQAGQALCADLLSSPAVVGRETDLSLLFKVLPCLERQETGAGSRILRGIRSRFVLLSFPVRSLGGREKGMRRRYLDYAKELAAGLGGPACEIPSPGELFVLIDRR